MNFNYESDNWKAQLHIGIFHIMLDSLQLNWIAINLLLYKKYDAIELLYYQKNTHE